MIILFCLSLLSGLTNVQSGTLVLHIENVQDTKGCLQIALFNSAETFLIDEKAAYTKTIYHETSGKIKVELTGLPYGSYALAIFHDEDGDGKLDKNLFGIPTEPYTFSNNPKIKWRGPQYEESKFEFNANNTSLVLQLRKWAKQ